MSSIDDAHAWRADLPVKTIGLYSTYVQQSQAGTNEGFIPKPSETALVQTTLRVSRRDGIPQQKEPALEPLGLSLVIKTANSICRESAANAQSTLLKHRLSDQRSLEDLPAYCPGDRQYCRKDC